MKHATQRERERPIIFSAAMVRAILDGRKTQTRRPIKGVPDGITEVHCWGHLDPEADEPDLWGFWGCEGLDLHQPHNCHDFDARCPYGAPGNKLWVRETWWVDRDRVGEGGIIPIAYRSDGDFPPYMRDERWRSPILMPRWASRITLEVVSVRVQRVQEITEADAIAEGLDAPRCGRCGYTRADCDYHMDHHLCDQPKPMLAVAVFAAAWDAINGKRAPWASNPWVWVVEFRRIP